MNVLRRWFDALVARFRKPAPVEVAKPAPAITPATESGNNAVFPDIANAVAFLRPRVGVVSITDLLVKLGRGMNDAEIAYAKSIGVVVPADPTPSGPAVDRSGLDVSDGSQHYYHLGPDGDLTVTYTLRPGVTKAEMRIVGIEGNSLDEVVSGYSTSHPAGTITPHIDAIPICPGQHNYTFGVKSRTGAIGVTLLQFP